MNIYHIEVKLCTGTDWCTALKPIEITAEHKEDVYKKILDGFEALEKQTLRKIEKSGYAFICPICHTWLQSPQKYCHECGQKINWH